MVSKQVSMLGVRDSLRPLHKKMGFNFSLADNDVWLRKCCRPNGSTYYTYILIYTNDILIVSHDPSYYMNQLKNAYDIKKESIDPHK